MSFGHGGKRVVPLPRDKEGKSADVEAFTRLTAVRFSVTHSTNFFLISTSNPKQGGNTLQKAWKLKLHVHSTLSIGCRSSAWDLLAIQWVGKKRYPHAMISTAIIDVTLWLEQENIFQVTSSKGLLFTKTTLLPLSHGLHLIREGEGKAVPSRWQTRRYIVRIGISSSWMFWRFLIGIHTT